MATDGADFQRRRPIHGRYYVALKNGDSVERLAELSVECLSNEARSRPMPMLRPMVDAIVNCLSAGQLFSNDQEHKQRSCITALRTIDARFADDGAGAEVLNACMHAAVELAQSDGEPSTDNVLELVGVHLQRIQSFESATDYAAHHRHLDQNATEELFQAQAFTGAKERMRLLCAIYQSPTGRPRRFKQKATGKFDYSPEGLASHCLDVQAR